MKLSVKGFMTDSFLNIIITFVPLIVLQFIIYPILAENMTQTEYGTMITGYSLIYLVGGTLGTELNKVRLVNDSKYCSLGIKGDFNWLLAFNLFLGVISCSIAGILTIGTGDLVGILLLNFTTIFIILNSYMEVAFRLSLEYKKLVALQMFNVIGYVIGLGLYFVLKQWTFIFICGLIIGNIYILKNTTLLHEPIKRTHIFKETLWDDIHLVGAGFLNRVLLYGDKILLLPLGGSEMVSIYYIASLIGKTILMSIEPINTVMLSYLVKIKDVSLKNFKYILLLLLAICSVGYFVCMVLSKPILRLLYPMWVDHTENLIWIVTLAMCLSAMGNVVNSFILKSCSMKWQTTINLIVVITFVILAVILIRLEGLFGYCVAVAVAYFVRLVLAIFIYMFTKQQDVKGEGKCNSEI